jgi:hypothetical protein
LKLIGDPAFLEYAKKLVDTVHEADPDVMFKGCLFENVSADVNKLTIPAWVFADFGLPVEDRTFSRAEIAKTLQNPCFGSPMETQSRQVCRSRTPPSRKTGTGHPG